jgi:hypothetical protein
VPAFHICVAGKEDTVCSIHIFASDAKVKMKEMKRTYSFAIVRRI